MVNPRYLHYRKYTPGPDPLAPPPDLTEAVRAIADDVMYGYSAEQALRDGSVLAAVAEALAGVSADAEPQDLAEESEGAEAEGH